MHASCPGFLHVLAALDETAALVIVLRVCDSLRVTLGVSLCGWSPGQPGRSESKYFWSVTFHRLFVMCGRVLVRPEMSQGRVGVHTDQASLWRKQPVGNTFPYVGFMPWSLEPCRSKAVQPWSLGALEADTAAIHGPSALGARRQ